MEIEQWFGFRVSKDWFLVDVKRVQEVIDPQELTTVPKAPPAVLGLMNLRGQIVTVVDLGRTFGGEPIGRDSRQVVLTGGTETTALTIHEPGEVYDAVDFEDVAVRENLSESMAGLVQRTLRHAGLGRVFLELDLERVLARAS